MKNRGLFITFEGGEGSGKSLHSERIYQALITQGYPVVLTREPGGTKISDQIRELLLAPVDDQTPPIVPNAELLLYLASRAQHVEELILPALQKGKVILCDRFADATVAYQGYGRRLDLKMLAILNDFAAKDLSPDFTILLNIDPKIGLERSRRLKKSQSKAGQLDRMESQGLPFHRAVQKGYMEISKSNAERIFGFDTSKPYEENHEQILNQIHQILKSNGITKNTKGKRKKT